MSDLKSLAKHKHVFIASLLLIIVFTSLRIFNIKDNLLFYFDMGRDFNVLLNWAETGKPPLLGPQTSVISYNQSAWYFYFLFPVFLLSDFSALSSTVTVIIVGSTTIVSLLWLTRDDTYLFRLVTVIAILLAVHPQIINQNRFVWNPSFVPYFLFVSLISVLLLRKGFSLWKAVLYWLSAAFAVGFSYSSVPVILGLSIYLLIFDRKHFKYHIPLALGSVFIVFLPTLAFEFRHSFALTKLLFVGQTNPQEIFSFPIRFQQLTRLLLPALTNTQSVSLLLFVVCGVFAGIWTSFITKSAQTKELLFLFAVLSFYFALQLLLPLNLEKHYIFPLLMLVFAVIASLPLRWAIAITSFLVIYWLQPYFLSSLTVKPDRTIAEMERCYQQFCQNIHRPIYVSMESGILAGFHNAPEHRFLMRKAGCDARDIEQSQSEATTMAIINESAEFTPGKTGYRELTLFGEYEAGEKLFCTENLSVQLIHKPTANTPASSVYQPQ